MDSTPCLAADVGGHQLVLHRLEHPPADLLQRLAFLDTTDPRQRAPKFPGPNPVSLDTSHFPVLASEPYYACEKTDGVRALLVCARVGSVALVALVDRAHAWYVFPLRHVPRAMFQGSLLDGELAWNKARGAWDYLVFDAVTVSGIPVLNLPLADRLAAADRALRAYRGAAEDPAALRIKSFVPCTNTDDVRQLLGAAQQSYDVDGLILTPALAPVTYGRHMRMFKLKHGGRHTVDFVVGGNGNDLTVFDAGKHAHVARLAPNTFMHAGAVVECCPRDDSFEVWDVVAVRTDKTTANDAFTFRKTLLNMRENLNWDAVFAAVFAHQQAAHPAR